MSALISIPEADRASTLSAILAAMPGNDCAIQRQRMLAAISQLGSVTSFEASRLLDCYYPPARIFELRKDGHNIKTLMRAEQTESGRFHRVGVWHLQGAANV